MQVVEPFLTWKCSETAGVAWRERAVRWSVLRSVPHSRTRQCHRIGRQFCAQLIVYAIKSGCNYTILSAFYQLGNIEDKRLYRFSMRTCNFHLAVQLMPFWKWYLFTGPELRLISMQTMSSNGIMIDCSYNAGTDSLINCKCELD